MSDQANTEPSKPACAASRAESANSTAGLGINREMLISLRTFKNDEDGSFGVECLVSGLANQRQAENAVKFIQAAFCGEEKSVN